MPKGLIFYIAVADLICFLTCDSGALAVVGIAAAAAGAVAHIHCQTTALPSVAAVASVAKETASIL